MYTRAREPHAAYCVIDCDMVYKHADMVAAQELNPENENHVWLFFPAICA